uniref:protein kinase domain-containing protein n=1 Tax=Deinococcus sp. TaxID=47478 RepID=UPI0025F7E673
YTVKLFTGNLTEHARREASMVVRHPQLAEVVTISEVGGQPAVVLRFTRGYELFRRYRLRPAINHEPRAYIRTLADVLSALGAMHDAGLLHRDVKADNVLVLASGEAHLLDFDLSGPSYEVFESPRRIGTAAYQSPEAERGEPLGPQSDLYSVGTLLYWGLRGFLPEELSGPLGSLGDSTFGLNNTPLEDLCRELLRSDPQRRPGSAEQVRAELLAAAAPLLGEGLD